MLSKLFGGGGDNSPSGAAQPYTSQIPGVAHEGYDRSIGRGRTADAGLDNEYTSMMNDPQAFMNHIMENYKPSEGYQTQKNELMNTMGNTSAAGGIAGTPMDQQNQAQGVQGLLSKDMQEYLANIMGIHDKGVAGEQGVSDRGYDAQGRLTDTLGNSLNQQGGMAFQEQQQQNKDANERQNSMWSIFGKALGAGGGFALGGPDGASAGYKLGGGAGNLFGGK